MQPKKPISIGQLREFVKIKFGKGFYVFLVCLALAFLFWLLNTFTKDYTTIIDVPVKYINFPEKKIVLNKLPASITVEIKGYGFTLLSQKFSSSVDTIVINGDRLREKSGDKGYSYLTTKSLLKSVASQFRSDIHINKFITDTIFFKFDTKITRIVPVIADIDLDFEKQYLLDGKIELIPAAVKISGPNRIVDTIKEIRTLHLEYSELNESITTTVGFLLTGIDTGLQIEPNKVLVKIPVDKFTEASITIPLHAEHIPDSLSMKFFPDSVRITYHVALNKYEKVSPDLFRVEVDYEELEKSNTGKLKVHLVKSPEFTRQVNYFPEKVEYIIKIRNN